ncbi:hypothetical protein YC2023_026121 [Brassica napus]
MPNIEAYKKQRSIYQRWLCDIKNRQTIRNSLIVKDSNEILKSWASNLEKLLDLGEKSCHQIHKETMIHKAGTKSLRNR